MGLPKTEAYKSTCWDKEKAKELYDMGYYDREIAEICGTTSAAVQSWRRRNGLTWNGTTIEVEEETPKPTLSEIAAEARAHGMTYGQYVVTLQGGKNGI